MNCSGFLGRCAAAALLVVAAFSLAPSQAGASGSAHRAAPETSVDVWAAGPGGGGSGDDSDIPLCC